MPASLGTVHVHIGDGESVDALTVEELVEAVTNALRDALATVQGDHASAKDLGSGTVRLKTYALEAVIHGAALWEEGEED